MASKILLFALIQIAAVLAAPESSEQHQKSSKALPPFQQWIVQDQPRVNSIQPMTTAMSWLPFQGWQVPARMEFPPSLQEKLANIIKAFIAIIEKKQQMQMLSEKLNSTIDEIANSTENRHLCVSPARQALVSDLTSTLTSVLSSLSGSLSTLLSDLSSNLSTVASDISQLIMDICSVFFSCM